ncbi:MAG: LLM class flavin-dependent oxidoreductase, partial [Pseudomonadota bacterium]|nr:LLM class flavin-dependent oxidoreductase [Pseudomonadota bacterium]
FELDYAPLIATGVDEEAIVRAVAAVRDRIAFYGCTVAYRPVLEIHGWGELQDELISLNRQRRRNEMSRLISDEVLETLAIVGDPRSVVEQMLRRFGGLIDRTGFSVPNISDDELGSVLEQLRS